MTKNISAKDFRRQLEDIEISITRDEKDGSMPSIMQGIAIKDCLSFFDSASNGKRGEQLYSAYESLRKHIARQLQEAGREETVTYLKVVDLLDQDGTRED